MKKILGFLVGILLVIGGLNWGLIGLANINLVSMIFGAGSGLEKIVYIVVGVAAVLKLLCMFRGSCCCCGCSCCQSSSCKKS